MLSGRVSATILAIFFALALGFAVSCGGGEGNNSQDGDGGGNAATEEAAQEQSNGETQGQGGETGQEQGSAPEIKIALGDIVSVDTDKRRLVLKPVEEERRPFKVTPNATVTLDDGPAELSDLEQGQQAQISYIVRKDLGRAREINAFSPSGTNE